MPAAPRTTAPSNGAVTLSAPTGFPFHSRVAAPIVQVVDSAAAAALIEEAAAATLVGDGFQFTEGPAW